MRDSGFNRNMLVWFSVSMLSMVLVFMASLKIVDKTRDSDHWVRHTFEVIIALERLGSDMKDAETGVRGYMLSRQEPFLKPFDDSQDRIPYDIAVLDSLVTDNKDQFLRLSLLKRISKSRLEIMNSMVTFARKGTELDSVQPFIVNGKARMDSIRSVIAVMAETEKGLLVERNAEVEASTNNVKLLIWIFMLLCTALGIVAYSLLSRDFRLRIKSENLLSGILNSSQSSIMAFRTVRGEGGKIKDFEWTLANRKTGDLFSLDSSSLNGKRMLKELPALEAAGMFEKFEKVADGQVQPVMEFELIKPGKKSNWLHVSAVKLEDGFTVTFDDITELKNYEEELRLKIEELERSNKELEQFAFVASHDMQEPLRKIRAFGDRLKEQNAAELTEKGKGYLEKMLASAQRMQNLINDILNFSRIGRINEPFVSTDLHRIVQDLLHDFDLIIKERNVSVEFRGMPVLEAIPSHMHQLFQNLISNAIKFSNPDANPQISIIGKRLENTFAYPTLAKEKNGYFCEITVRDNGIGFDDKYIDKIFTIFQRLHGKNEFEGTGIGLAICKKIVEHHNGYITAKSEPGKGAAFIIVLPYKHIYG
ncbi:MAG: CHASE3 domain-containing protein [Bacteroidota bacterium]